MFLSIHSNLLLLMAVGLLLLSSCQSDSSDTIAEAQASSDFILDEAALPDYEKHLDHKALVADWSEEFYHKGMVTYREACFSCHGNVDQAGSIPNSRQFWKESFKNGSDPYSMYQTLTRGYGMMPPQVRLTPKEKYEVIHFIREEFIKESNPDEYFEITKEWINSLPKGDTLGPAPKPYQPWKEMDYGNFLIHTYELANSDDPPRNISGGRSPLPNEDYRDLNFAYKGIAIRLDEGEGGVAEGEAFVLFDHDLLRLTGFWTGEGFIDYEGILLNDRHNIYPRTVGSVQVENPITPGWANPATNDFKDPRFVAVDGRPFGPLPKKWAHYKGLYYHEDRVVVNYSVGDAEVLETYDLEASGENPVLSRTLNISPSSQPLQMRIAPVQTAVALKGVGGTLTKAKADGFQVLNIPANQSAKIKLWLSAEKSEEFNKIVEDGGTPEDLTIYTKGGPTHYPNTLKTPILKGAEEGAYAVDVLSLPQENPWKSRMRPTGIDFLDDGDEAVLCTIDGEVWQLKGITQLEGNIEWRRIATGLFQPLGIKYHRGAIYVGCRDQIVKLVDLNGDGETDFYENFNSDHQVTEHFHEFAMGLQTDEAGNFYYAKSARHARTPLVPQHGTLMKVSPDGSTSEIIAHGFRAANGVCLNPDGSFIVTDQQGHWNPMNRINWVTEGGFYGNMYGYGAPKDSSDAAMQQPLSWIDMKYDRSPAELLWADSDRWGPLNGHLLNLSYGYGKLFAVLMQEVGDTRQGGMIELPIPAFPTGVMRGRFNPKDGQLYTCGMSAWATNQMIQVGGLYRVRYTGKPLHLPVQLSAHSNGMKLTFPTPLNPEKAIDPDQFEVNTWDIKRTRNYGSDRFNLKSLAIEQITISEDNRTLFLQLPDIQPTWCMEILYELESEEGAAFEGALQNSIYQLERASNDVE